VKTYLYIIFVIVFCSCSSESGNNDSTDDNPITCNTPNGNIVSDVSENSVTINWNIEDSKTYEIEYGILNFTQGQGQSISNLNSSTDITNLEAETIYQYYIRTNCGNNNFSSWLGPFNFTTAAAPITCESPVPYLMTSLTNESKKISWFAVENADSYTIEYGHYGFNIGEGQTINTDETSAIIEYVNIGPVYELYLKANCNDNTSSNWVGPLAFATNGSYCGATNLTVVPIDLDSVYLNWGVTWITGYSPDSWIIEYGVSGFEVGNGTTITTPDGTLGYVIEDLLPSTDYEFYIKGNCSNNGQSLFTGYSTYTTFDACPSPSNLQINYTTQCSASIIWASNYASEWLVEYGSSGFNIGEGILISTTNNILELSNLIPGTTYDFYVKTDCGTGEYSETQGPLSITTKDIKYTGSYLYESLIDGQNGPVFGDSQVVDIIEVDEFTRRINVVYYENLNQGNLPFEFEFFLNCDGKIIVAPNQDTKFFCGSTTVEVGPTSGAPASYDDYQNDDILSFTFYEYTNYESCDSGYLKEVFIKLTKI